MGEKLIDLLGKIVTGPKSRIFWAFVIVALVIGIIIFPYIDANYLYYDRIERRINNLQTLVDLTGIPLQENKDLFAEYESIIEEMGSAREKALSNTVMK